MGGRLQVESTYGEGSEFYFSLVLPVYQGELQAPHVQEGDIRLEGLHVLLAEDNDLNAEIAEELLALEKNYCRPGFLTAGRQSACLRKARRGSMM